MPLPRKAEFDAALLNGSRRVCGAPFWAYGSSDGTGYPWNGWPGWTSITNNPNNPGQYVDGPFYYDAGRTFFSIADYTQDSQWTAIAHRALEQGFYPWVERPFDNAAFFLPPPDPPRCNLQALHMLPWGTFLDWQRNPDATARARALRIVYALGHGNFGHFTPLSYYGNPTNQMISREVGYNLLCKSLAKRAGFLNVYPDPWNGWYGKGPGYFYPLWGLRAGDFEYGGQGMPPGQCVNTTLQSIALEILRQDSVMLSGGVPTCTDLSVGGTASGFIDPKYLYARPFMICNIIEGLAEFDAEFGDARILPAVLDVLEKMWSACFLPSGITMQNTVPGGGPAPVLNMVIGINAMRYTDRMSAGDNSQLGDAPGDPTTWVSNGSGGWAPYACAYRPVPELNGLIIPSYFWAYQKTGNTMWRDRCDLLFDGLVRVLPAETTYGTEVGQMFWNSGKIFNQVMARTGDYILDAIGAVVPPPVDPPPASSVPTIAVNTRIVSENTTGLYLGTPTVEDCYLRQVQPTTNFATLDRLETTKYSGAGDHTHSVIRFVGLSTIPVNATIVRVTLGLNLDLSAVATSNIVDIRRCLRAWIETQATWVEYATGSNWGTAGGIGDGTDRVATASGQITGITLTLGWYTVTQTTTGGLITDVQNWVNGTQVNNGWHLERNGVGNDLGWRIWNSSNKANTDLRPYLLVDYSASTVFRQEETASLLARGASTMIALDAGSAP